MSTKKHNTFKSKSKRQRSGSPVPTSTSHERADPSEEPTGEHKNKRVRFETAASPTHSHLSLASDWSIDLPTNFKGRGAFTLNSREKLERAESPTHSYLSLRTDWSMDLPTNFKRHEALNTRMGLDRASSPTLSSVSEWTECFVEQPTNSKTEAAFHLDPRLLTENYLKCPKCKSMLRDPVSISCGHNYCRDCINTFWDGCAEEYVCPECGRGSKTRPELHTNAALAEVVKNLQQAGFSPALPPSSYAGPEDVACDFCSERRLKAVKSCSTCDVFLCETHIKEHYTIPALQKHTLCDVTGAMEKKLSQKLLPTDNNFSEMAIGNQSHTDKAQKELMGSFFKSMLNAAKPKTKPKAKVNKDNTNVQTLKLMYSTLQQEVSGLKKSLSKKFSKKTKKEKYYDKDEQYDEEEEVSDASDSDEGEEDESDDEESEASYDDGRHSSDRSDEEDSGDEEDKSDEYDKDVSERSNEENSSDEEVSGDDEDLSDEEDSSERSYDKRSYDDSEDGDDYSDYD